MGSRHRDPTGKQGKSDTAGVVGVGARWLRKSVPKPMPLVWYKCAMSELDEAKVLLDQAVQAAETKAEEAQAEVARLRAEQSALEAAITRVRKGAIAEPGAVQDAERKRWLNMYRTDAIVEMLRLHGEAIGPSAIAKLLRDVGREKDTAELVGAAMEHLKKRGRIRRVGPGRWVAAADGKPLMQRLEAV